MENAPSLEEFVKMAAFVKASHKDFERLYRVFDIDEERWTEISIYWMGQISGDSMIGARFRRLMTEEIDRLEAVASP